VYANGSTNLTFDSGSLVMWCQPNWTSSTDGGTGPGAWAPLWQVGVYSTNNLYGCWSLAVSPGGNTLAFITQTNRAGEIHAQIPIDWDAGDWHNLVITYCPTNCSIYLEGALIINTPPIAYWPGPDECSNGFFIGSDPTGTWQAHAQFQELETYDVPLTADYIQGQYAFYSSYILAWGESVPTTGSGIFTADVPTLPGGGGGTNGGGGGTNSPRIPLPNYTSNSDIAYADYTNFYLTIGTSVSGTAAVVTVQNSLSNLTYNILTNSILDTNLADWGLWQTRLATNSIILAPPMNIGSNALFFDASLVWSTTTNGLPDWWQMKYFGNLLQPTNGDYDGDGVTDLQAYANGTDPNIIRFQISFTNQYVNLTNVPLWLGIQGGLPHYWAVQLDNTNFPAAIWSPYTSSNITANLGTVQGWHTVWVGLRGLPADAQQTWNAVLLNLDTNAPILVVTNATNVTIPLLQLQGYANEELASLTFDLTNANGAISNQTGFMTGAIFDTNSFLYTNNSFKCLDLALASGMNRVSLHAADLAGNVTTTNFAFILNYSNKPPPVIQLYWPQNGTQISGPSFTCRGTVDDPSVNLSAHITDTNGNTNIVAGVIERNGNFWVDNIPLSPGNNNLTLTATDINGHTNSTNISVVQSSVVITINPITDDLNQSTVTVTGTISATNYTLWVNGVATTNFSWYLNTNFWTAINVPMNGAGSAVVQVRAIPNTPADNYGNGSTSGGGGTNSSLSNPGNPTSPDCLELEINQAKSASLSCDNYHFSWNWSYGSVQDGASTNTQAIDWSAQTGGSSQTSGPGDYWTYSLTQCQWDTNGVGTIQSSNILEGGWFVLGPIVDGPSPYVGPTNFSEGLQGHSFGSQEAGFNTWVGTYETGVNSASSRYKLHTGGRSLAGRPSLWRLAANAQQIVNPWYPEEWSFWYQFNLFLPIPCQQVTILGEPEESDGAVYIYLPDGEAVEATPHANSIDYLTFDIGYAKEDPQIYFGGANVTDTNTTVIVGQQITLTCTNGQYNPAISNFNWSVDGLTFSNYVASAQSGTLYTDFQKTNSQVTFYWADGGRHQVSCTAKLAGQTTTAQTTFNVLRPTATMTPTITGQILVDNNYARAPGTALHFAGYWTNGTSFVPGIKFQINNVDTNGSYFFAQITSLNRVSLPSGLERRSLWEVVDFA
jgi:hypothetical protein